MRWVRALACLLLAAAVHMHDTDPIQDFMNHDHTQDRQVHEQEQGHPHEEQVQGQEAQAQAHEEQIQEVHGQLNEELAKGLGEDLHQDLHQDLHLTEHMRHQSHLNLASMSTAEKQFHLFLSHDYDNDYLLDGIELIQSLVHGKPLSLLSDHHLSNNIDFLLNNFDADQDGKLSFPEYMRSVMGTRSP